MRSQESVPVSPHAVGGGHHVGLGHEAAATQDRDAAGALSPPPRVLLLDEDIPGSLFSTA